MQPNRERERPSAYEIDQRASDAQGLLEHPLLKEALERMHSEYMAVILSAPVGSSEAISAQAGLQVINKIRSYLQSVVTDKKMYQKYREKFNG